MPFCVGCGVRVEPGVRQCPACEARSAMRGCPRCGAPLAGQQSRFCVACGAALAPSSPAAPATASGQAGAPPARSAPPQAPRPALAKDDRADIDSARQARAAIYQRLGRLLLGACYEGKLPYDRLPDELARQARAGIETIRKGHVALAAAGVCPRCLEATLSGDPPTCSRCRLVVPGGKGP